DAINRRTKVTEAKGTADQRSMTYAYDKAGNRISVTDWRGYRTDTTYDSDNRPTVVKEAAGIPGLERVTTTVYDAHGTITSRIDALGRTTTFAYDALDRQVSQTEAVGTPDAATTRELVDAEGEPTGEVDELGAASLTFYDALQRPIVRLDALWNTAREIYDAA